MEAQAVALAGCRRSRHPLPQPPAPNPLPCLRAMPTPVATARPASATSRGLLMQRCPGRSVDWAVAIEAADSPVIFPVVDPASGELSGVIRPYNECVPAAYPPLVLG